MESRSIRFRFSAVRANGLKFLAMLSSKERAALRAEAHHLAVTVHVGHQGVTDSVRQSLDDAIRTRELVKIQFSRNDEVNVKDAANDLARAMGADIVQVIGRTATLYRENPELKDEPRRDRRS
jgi:RNA-binding protein